jgi:choline kinase
MIGGSLAVVIAAGPGSRLRPLTSEVPKCMLDVQKKPMLHRALDTFRDVQIPQSVVVGGYKVDKLELPDDCTLLINDDYENNNILHSLAYARKEMQDASPVIISYSDIVFRESVVTRLLADNRGDITVVVDRGWDHRYVGRDLHPLAEAEGATYDDQQLLRTIRKGLITPESDSRVCGEFIGMMKLTPKGQEIFWGLFDETDAMLSRDDPFQRASAWRLAYVTDLLQELIDHGVDVHCSLIHGGWLEIDTVQDYEYAARFDFSGEEE